MVGIFSIIFRIIKSRYRLVSTCVEWIEQAEIVLRSIAQYRLESLYPPVFKRRINYNIIPCFAVLKCTLREQRWLSTWCFFENTENKERHRKLDAALDTIRQKYGNDKITRASIMNSNSGIARKARAQMQNELETRRGKQAKKGTDNGNIWHHR